MKTICNMLLLILILNIFVFTNRTVKAIQMIDGIINDQEYPQNKVFQNGDFELNWRIDGEIITFAMKAKTNGWVSIGIDPEFKMKNADIYIGWVTKEGVTELFDAFCSVPMGPHPPDTEQGGNNDILLFAGKEEGNYTTLEFNRKLDTQDLKDKVIPKTGKLKIMVAYGATDEFSPHHIFRTTDEIDLEPVIEKPTEKIILRFKINSLTYWLGTISKNMDSPPIVKEGRTLLPIRYLAEAIGATVTWDAKTQQITLQLKQTFIVLTLGQNIAIINGVPTKIDPDNLNVKPIVVPPGRTLLPLRFVAERLNCLVAWNPENQEITITYPK
jgi:hypothetical protein